MSRSTQWLCLIAGIMIFGYGLLKLFGSGHEWVPFILGMLIIAFTISKMLRSKGEQ